MNMVGHATDTVAFAPCVASHGCKVGMQLVPNVSADQWTPIFGAEDNVNDDKA